MIYHTGLSRKEADEASHSLVDKVTGSMMDQIQWRIQGGEL